MHISNMRRDFLHKLSTTLIKNDEVVCVEDLNVNGMIRNRRLSRSISDAAWAKFYEFLDYKCSWFGKQFIKVPRYFPSSKLCSSCGNSQEMPLHVRLYRCMICGLELDRDLNASINIRMAGLSILKACGETNIGLLSEAGITGLKTDESQ